MPEPPRRPLIARLRDTAGRQRAQGWNVSADLLFEAADRLEEAERKIARVEAACDNAERNKYDYIHGETAAHQVLDAVRTALAKDQR